MSEQNENEEIDFEWTPEAEVHLLVALFGLQLVGPARIFIIIMVWERFMERIGMYVPLRVVKEKLYSYYNFDALDKRLDTENEFPFEEFSLPPDIMEYKRK